MFVMNGAVFIFLSLAVGGLSYYLGRWELVMQGIQAGIRMTWNFFPLLVIAMFLAGQGEALMMRYLDTLKELIAGSRGLVMTWLAAIVTPSSWALYPMFLEMWERKIGRLAILFFISVFPVMSWTILPMRASLLGWRLALITYGIGLGLGIVGLCIFLLARRLAS